MDEPNLFDTHTHLNFKVFKNDLEEVADRALGERIWLNNVGTKLATSKKAVSLTEKFETGVFASVGLHPVYVAPTLVAESVGASAQKFVTQAEHFDQPAFEELVIAPKVVAVGEIGLDYFRLPPDNHDLTDAIMAAQKKAFLEQLQMATAFKKPVVIHCRNAPENTLLPNAQDDILAILEQTPNLAGGIAHFFTGSLAQAARYLKLGFLIAFGGVITFTNDYDELIENAPLDKIVIETDAPYVTPVPHRGRRNEPAFVKFVAQKVAAIKNLPQDQVAAQTTQNALEVFGIA